MDYCIYSDEEVAGLIASGDQDAEEYLAKKYLPLVKKISRKFFLMGGESEDLIQEGTFGLVSAIRKYSASSGVPFSSFAEICIKNRIISAVKSSSSNKHTPLNAGISLDEIDFDFLPEYTDRSAEEYVIASESRSEFSDYVSGRLSRFEKQVLSLYLDGLSYLDISEKMGKKPKSIDNAIQRIRKKLSDSNKA